MKHSRILLVLLLALLVSSEGWAAWVKAFYKGFDGPLVEFTNGSIRVLAGEPRIYLNWINGGGNPPPWFGSRRTYNLDGQGDITYTQGEIPINGLYQHTLVVKLWQYNDIGQELPVAITTYIFTLVYPTPAAPTLSISSTGSPAYHPVLSWNDIGYYAVQQNTTNGYEIYRRDYQGDVLWHDWSKKASVGGTETSWTDGSIGGAPMGLDKVEYRVHAVDIVGQVGPFSNVVMTRVFFQYKLFAGSVPDQYSFKEGYPNPFNPTTHMQYDLPSAGNVSMLILDIQGREVKTLQAGFTEAGSYGVTWNAADQATGVYFARLLVTDQLGNAIYTKTNKLLLTK